MSTATVRLANILRELDETCQAAAELRTVIERQMGSAHAREKLAKDDTAVITARNTARKEP